MVNKKVAGVMAVAILGLLLYVGIYVGGVTLSTGIMTVALFLGLGLTLTLFVLIILITRGKTED
ncbi:hypothetical protein [Pararhodospirillum oryzae]|uniref:Uncharacterized protein n=1 Tax=Pararhodospirillum oryzae TaxID=478448 RepID=A0A512H3J8_9PROT|nr:hypothetical protein [Pararhodospirillum oryzae]GEO80035.1 hypothetical protein ROR02_01660 [Pararhodospirillum oryzae]